ncbi:SCO1431 family membrane protein [Streptomyces sp. NBC_01217]|uniref:SCO1431 family membrane protein n=1 Tax=Streptomyces sp. NBC_01217 TaxID=2903779 RepID=UPI002E15AEAB|nr:SCO1431 family membrane protein [Streptomyces sp. NBC_01217]
MTATAAETATTPATARLRARTGGPKDGPKVLETVLGWTLVVVIAMFVTQAGLM